MNKVIYSLIFILLLTTVSAQEIDVKSSETKNIILPDEQAEFQVQITNNQADVDRITYVIEDLNWGFDKKFIDIEKGATYDFNFILTPPKNIEPGFYSINLKTYSLNKAKVSTTTPLLLTVVDENDLIDIKLDYSPNGLVAGKENRIKLILKNKYNIPIDNVKLKLNSTIFSDQETLKFSPGESITKELFVLVKEDTEGTTYDLNIVLLKNNKEITNTVKKLVIGIQKDIQKSIQESNNFLKSQITITTQNKGNANSQETHEVRLNSLQKTFTSFNPEPNFEEKRNGIYYYTWTSTLKPGETTNITANTNFRDPLIILLVLIILAYIIHSVTKSHLSVLKKVLTVKFGEGISDMKVQLVIKNRGKGTTQNVRVVDYLPKVVKTPTEYGTIKPNKVKKSLNGLMLIWDIPELLMNEERVISYRIKSKIHVIGRLVIPKAIVRYKTKKGKSYIANSKRIILFSR